MVISFGCDPSPWGESAIETLRASACTWDWSNLRHTSRNIDPELIFDPRMRTGRYVGVRFPWAGWGYPDSSNDRTWVASIRVVYEPQLNELAGVS